MTCYYPDGNPGVGLSPCNTTAPVSHCCRSGDVCISNGLCFSAGLNTVVRRGCTDKTFNDTACAQQCNTNALFKSADVVLTPCEAYGTFCCGQDEAARECCNNGNGTVKVQAGSAMLGVASVTVSVTGSISAASATVTVTSSPTINNASSGGNYNTQKNITIGVGAGLGALLIVVAALLGWKLYGARKLNKDITKGDVELINRA